MGSVNQHNPPLLDLMFHHKFVSAPGLPGSTVSLPKPPSAVQESLSNVRPLAPNPAQATRILSWRWEDGHYRQHLVLRRLGSCLHLR